MNNNTFFVDGIQSAGVHNGVVRIQLFKLGANGKAEPTVELQLPVNQLKGVVEGLRGMVK